MRHRIIDYRVALQHRARGGLLVHRRHCDELAYSIERPIQIEYVDAERPGSVERRSILCSENQGQEAELIVKAQAGSRDAFDSLFHLHKQFVHNVCYMMMGCGEDAVDATQTAFIRAYGSLKGFRRSCAFRTWLYRIAVNVCKEMIRGRQRRARLSELNPSPAEEEASDDVLQVAIRKLPADTRAVLVLFYFQQLPIREVAEALGCSEGAAKARLHRARAALKMKYEEMMG